MRQIGASMGTALLAVALQHESKALLPASAGGGGLLAPLSPAERARISRPAATVFGHTFAWAVAIALLAMVPAAALWRAERASRAAGRTPVLGGPQVEGSR
jgi:hypothetical protein